jgi:DNA end-binding protein Ku
VARAIWTGALSFGLVNVPVGLYSATEDRTIHFHQIERGTADRVRQKRVNERTGEEVTYDAITKGYDLGGGRYVIIEPEELEAVEPGKSKNIEITDFVNLDDIDIVSYKTTYYLAPQGKDAQRAYALLRQAMNETGKVAIATLIMRGKQNLVAIRPTSQVLALETMYFWDEVRNPAEALDTLPDEDVTFEGRELDTAKLLIDSMTNQWSPQSYHDTYREAVDEMIERKSRGEVIAVDGQKAEPAPVVDLMEALRASVEAARAKRQGGSAGEETSDGDETKAVKKKATKASKSSSAEDDEAVAS